MSVLKALRSLSTMEYYKNAVHIRRDITQWMLRDFGARKNPKNVALVIKDISDEDRATVDEIFEKYGRSTKKEFQYEYPDWFVDFERRHISDILHDMMTDITEANSIYPVFVFEFELRRTHQDNAIAACYRLYQELQYIQSLFPQDLNRFAPLLGDIEREVNLLKGWRQSDNKRLAGLKDGSARRQ